MLAISRRWQIGAVVSSYAFVIAVSAVLIFVRYLQYAQHPEDVASAGGMYAAGDSMLAMFIVLMLWAATILLIAVIRSTESAYTRYAQSILGLSLTAPVCVGLLAIPRVAQSTSIFGFAFMFRLETSPVMIAGFVISRLAAKFATAKRLTSIAIGIEVLTLVAAIAGLFLLSR
jgi:hypothetical protein